MASKKELKELNEIKGVSQSINKTIDDGTKLSEKRTKSYKNNSNELKSISSTLSTNLTTEKKINDELVKQNKTRQQINESFKPVNVLSDEFNKVLSGASKLTDDITKNTDNRNKKLSEQIGFTQSILSNIKSEEDIKDAINNLEKQKTDISKTNLGVNEKHKEGYLAIVQSIKEALTTEQSRKDVLEQTEKETNNVTKSMVDGLDNLVDQIEQIPVVGKVFKKLIPVDDLKNRINQIGNNFIGGFTNSFKKVRAAGGSFSKSLATSIKSGFSGIKRGFMAVFANPLSIAIGLFTLVAAAGVLAFYKISEAAKQFRQETGLLISQTPNLEKNINQAYINTVGLGASMEEVTQSATAFTREFKNLQQPSQQTLESIVALSKNFGVIPETAAQVTKLIHDMTGATADQAQYFTNNVALLSQMAGVAPQQVMDDIANSSEESYKYFGGSEKALLRAGIFAAKMGTSIKKMSESAKGLLDFESSITDQMEASAILGRNLNLNQARYFAMTGKIPEMHEAIGREVDKIGDITKLNVFQQEALAKATGVPFNDLVEQQKIRRRFGKLDAEQLAAVQAQIKSGKELKDITREDIELKAEEIKQQQEMQSEFDKMSNELKKIGVTILQSLMPVGKFIMGLVEPVSVFANIFTQTVSPALNNVKNAAMSILEPLGRIFGTAEEKFGVVKTLGKVFGGAFNVIINTVAVLFKGIGNFITAFEKFGKGDILGGIEDALLGTLRVFVPGWKWIEGSIMTLMDLFPKFGEKVNSVIETIKTKWENFKSIFSFGKQIEEEGKNVEKAGGGILGTFLLLSVVFGTFGKKILSVFSGLGKTITSPFKLLGKVMMSPFKLLGGLGRIFSKIGTGIVGLMKGIGSSLVSMAKGAGTILTSVGKGMGSFISSIAKGIGTAISSLAKGIGSSLMMLGKGIGTFISAILKGIATGIGSFAAAAPGLPIFAAAMGIVVLSILGLSLALRIAGPYLENFGRMMKTIFEGIATVIVPIIDTLVGGITRLAEIIGGTLIGLMNAFAPIVKTVADAFVSIAEVVGNTIIGVFDSVNNTLSMIIQNAGKAGELFTMAQAITAVGLALGGLGVATAAGGVLSSLGGLFSSGADWLSGKISGEKKDTGAFSTLEQLSSMSTQIEPLAQSLPPVADSISLLTSQMTILTNLASPINTLAESMNTFATSIGNVNEKVGGLNLGKLKELALQVFKGDEQETEGTKLQTPNLNKMSDTVSVQPSGVAEMMTLFTETNNNNNTQILQKLDELKTAYLQNKDVYFDGQKLTNSVSTVQQRTSTNRFNTLGVSN